MKKILSVLSILLAFSSVAAFAAGNGILTQSIGGSGGSATPGGSSGQLQYNNSGALGGVTTGSSVASAAINTLSGGMFLDPRDPQFGSNTCTGYYNIATSARGAGGTGYVNGDTFQLVNTLKGGGTTATGHVTNAVAGIVQSGGYTIDTAGGGFYASTTYATTATSGAGTGLTITVSTIGTGNDDTAALTAAGAVASVTGQQLWIPHGCWVSGWTPQKYLHVWGPAVQATYSYDGTIPPLMYVIGHPTYGIHTTNEGVSLHGFEVNATYDAAAFVSTTCIGSTTGNLGGGGYGEKNTLRSMSVKGCATGYGSIDGSGSYMFTDIYDSDFGANDYGIRAPISDLILDHSVFAADSHTGLWLTASAGGSARISNNRFEYNKMGMELDGAGGFQSSLSGNQCDRADNACLYVHGVSALTLTNEQYKGGGAAGSLSITGAIDNGSGLIRLTVLSNYGNAHSSSCTTTCATNGLTTGDKITVSGVVMAGATVVNGNWTLTKIDTNHIDLQASTFVGGDTYTSGGFGGVKGKDSAVYIDGVSNQISFDNFFCSGTSAGAVMPSIYCIEGDSAATIAHITVIGGIANLSPLYSNSGFLVSFDHWLAGTPTEYLLDVIGAPYFRNDYIALTGTTTQDFAVGRNGLTNPSFAVDDSAASAVTGIKVSGKAVGNSPVIQVTSTGANEGLNIATSGTGDLILKVGSTIKMDYGNTSATATTPITLTSNSSTAFVVGPNGQANPVLTVNGSVASQADGIRITGNAAGSGVTFAGTTSGSNAPINVTGAGTGNINLQNNGGNIAVISSAGEAVTGVLSASSTVQGTQLISTIATGTAPLTVASTTNVANLNASTLGGATFASPGAIGGGSAAAGTFTTMTANSYVPNSSTIPTDGFYLPASNQSGIADRTLPVAYFTNPASAVNYWSFSGAATGVAPTLLNLGTDTNGVGLGMAITGKSATAQGAGGGVAITAGNGFASGATAVGGTVTITGGSSASASTQTFNGVDLEGGAATNGAGGSIKIQGGNATTTASPGGAIVIQAGTSISTQTGPAASMTGGTGGNSGNQAGGTSTVKGGTGTSAGAGGVAALTGGTPGATGAGGAVTLTSGAGGATSGVSGNINLNIGAPVSGADGVINFGGGTISTGTKFTTSGCSISSTTGGAVAGKFTLGANTCTAVVTLNGAVGATAPNGWACSAFDQTAPLIVIGESSSNTTTASFSIPATAGATDVIEFYCMGY